MGVLAGFDSRWRWRGGFVDGVEWVDRRWWSKGRVKVTIASLYVSWYIVDLVTESL